MSLTNAMKGHADADDDERYFVESTNLAVKMKRYVVVCTGVY